MSANVAMAYLTGMLASLGRYEIKPQQLLQQQGIDVALLNDPDARISFADYVGLWHHAEQLTGDPLFGVEVGTNFHPGNLGDLAGVLVTAPSLYEAAKQLIRYEHLLQDGIVTKMGLEDNKAYIEYSCTDGFEHADVRQLIEKEAAESVALAHYMLRPGLSDEDLAAIEVWFCHTEADPSHRQRYQALLQAPVQFSKPYNRVWFDPGLLSMKTLSGNEGVFRSVLKEFEQQSDVSLEAQVRRYIADQLHQGVPEIKAVADAFNMSHRTFQRRLAEQDTHFKDLVSQVRKERAIQMLSHSQRSISEIAYLVGFTEASTFHQAFKRWTGQSPGEYRKSSLSE